MEAKCQAMMAEHEKMMADMKAADQRLDGLVATMNTASGMEKMAATAAVVTEMVTQRRTMRDGMMKMQEDMMAHMMEHMQAGKDSMAMCPMMKMMKSKPMGGMKHYAACEVVEQWPAPTDFGSRSQQNEESIRRGVVGLVRGRMRRQRIDVAVRADGICVHGGGMGRHCVGFEQFDRRGQHDGAGRHGHDDVAADRERVH